MLLTPLQKLTKNVEDLGKLLDAKGLKKLPKAQKIAQSGHNGCNDPISTNNREISNVVWRLCSHCIG